MRLGVLILALTLSLCAFSESIFAADVTISEFLSVNDNSITDSYGDHSDWLELHNTTGATISLAGWYLTDDAAELTKWQLPDVSLAADQYMVIFASDKDDTDPASELHTNFKLSSSGEYIALVRPDGVTVEFSYPPVNMSADVSYGLDAGGSSVYFDTPTPGEGPVGGTVAVSPVGFSVNHGFFDESFTLVLTCDTLGATIRYTTDGSEPTAGSGNVYSAPITISDTTVVRAAAFRSGFIASEPLTQSYIFLDSVLTQSNNQTSRGFPDTWIAGAGGSGIYDSKYRSADYEMDPDVMNNPTYGPHMIDALTSIPTISMVMDMDDLFDPYTGIYPNSIQRASTNPMWEKPASLELIDPTGENDFTINCGSRIMGEVARWAAVNDKQSFRIVFQEEYGPTKLKTDFFGSNDGVDKYDTLVMRANWGDGFQQDALLGERLNTSWLAGTPWTSQYLRDIYGHDVYKATGQIGVDGRFTHLYINGLYWGVYEVIERPDNNFHGQHFAGSDDEFDVFKGAIWNANNGENGIIQDGQTDTWYKLLSYFDCYSWNGENIDNRFTTIDNAELAEIEKYLDVDAFIDFMITLWVIDRGDFPKKNWYAVCRRNPDGGAPLMPFKFYTWDNEASLWEVEGHFAFERWNYVGVFPADKNDTGPVRIYKRLRTNKDFCMRWAQRVEELLSDGGPLSTEALGDMYQARIDEVKLALYAESARWGDTAESQEDDPILIEDQWKTEADRLINDYFPVRLSYVMDQMLEVGMYPELNKPTFVNEGGLFQGVIQLDIEDDNTDSHIVYTIDGTDPRKSDNDMKSNALLIGISIPMATEVNTWLYSDWGEDFGAAWTALDFDDSNWHSGVGQFGYGDGDETTLLEPLLTDGKVSMTTYFRVVVNLAEPIVDLPFDMLVDDGAIVYVNGVEVLRHNMPAGEISFDTPAASSVVSYHERLYTSSTIDAAYLVPGLNVIAVEVHQDSPYGSDVSFDMELPYIGLSEPFSSIPIEYDVHVVARSRSNDGDDWSVYAEEFYFVDAPSEIEISEIHYHPADPSAAELAAGFDADDFEFIELHNPGLYQTVENAAAFVDGIEYQIPTFTLDAGEYAVLVSNDEAFRMRFGDSVRIVGDYGDRLSNGGENIRLEDSFGELIVEFAYDDEGFWATPADGFGFSLNLLGDKSRDDLAGAWIASDPTPGLPAVGLSGMEGDFNYSGNVDGDDIQMLIDAVGNNSDDLQYDIDNSGGVDSNDIAWLFEVLLNFDRCDFTMDGTVNIFDFLVLKANYGSAGRWDQGDANFDGFIDINDFLFLKARYGYVSPAGN